MGRIPECIDEDYILNRVIITDFGCWEWALSRDEYGYGKVNQKTTGHTRAHRLSYEIFIGKIPPMSVLRHSCDNQPCCNPEHLIPGSDKDNHEDAVARQGRDMKRLSAMATATTRLAADIVSAVVKDLEHGEYTYKQIAHKHNISTSAVCTINQRRK